MSGWLWFLAGLFAGALIGALIVAACAAAGRADRDDDYYPPL